MSELFQALARVQEDVPKIIKKRDGVVETRSRTFRFKYADLSDLLEAVQPALRKHSLVTCFLLEPGPVVTLRLVHVPSGETLTSSMPITTDGGNLAFGANLTFIRRHLLAAMLNISAEDERPAGEDVAPPQSLAAAEAAAASGLAAYQKFWTSLSPGERKALAPYHSGLKAKAAQ